MFISPLPTFPPPFPLPSLSPIITSREDPSTSSTSLTRTHKATDRDHAGLANGTAAAEEHLPRYFGKSGFTDNSPAGTKKQGGGKGNWGREGQSELEDYDYNMTKTRRRTNSFSAAAGHSALKTKFEALDPEAIDYEEYLHGPSTADLAELEKMSTHSSAETMGSIEEEDAAATVTEEAAGKQGEKKRAE